MKYPHDNHYDPPFPAVEVVLHNEGEDLHTVTLPALLDTGADGSFVPLDHLQEILAIPLTDGRVRSHWGEWRSVQLFVVEIELKGLNLSFPGVFVVGDDVGDEIILGRNFINKIRLAINGPEGFTDIRSQ